jgi:ribose 5-phosphate isomerase B
MTVNKHQGIRCALAWDSEIAQLARAHNDANIVSIPARYVTLDKAMEIVGTFIETEFEGGRHQNRVSKIPCTP